MLKNFGFMANARLTSYLEGVFQPEDAVLRRIRELSERSELPGIQVGPFDARHLEVLVLASGARRAVEIGTLGGYSGTVIARALGAGGKLYTCELEEKNAQVAREAFGLSGVQERVEILVGPAIESLPKIEKNGPFDFLFIDADKVNYPRYLAWGVENLRVGGVIVGDNTFAFGMLADQTFESEEDRRTVEGIRAFNEELARGGRFRSTIFPTGEGLTVGVKVR